MWPYRRVLKIISVERVTNVEDMMKAIKIRKVQYLSYMMMYMSLQTILKGTIQENKVLEGETFPG